MLKLIEALANAGIPAPRRDTETFKIVRWGRTIVIGLKNSMEDTYLETS